ncbi:MAG TPA: helix-turn-helix domain-containing protein [Opitutaceae bacterium]|nr:helix-turn-helix domain-containing protein [Opitutaceae bacterium]
MNTLPDGDHFLLLPEAAELLRTSTKTVRRLIDEGKIKIHKIRGRILIRSSDLMAFIKSAAR